MNSCPNKSKLLGYKLELLDRTEMREIEEHLKRCRECRRELDLEMTIEKILSEPVDAGEIESSILRRVKVLRGIPYPTTVFGSGFWRIIFYTLSAIGLAYALFVYLEKMIAQEGVGAWLTRMADFLSSMPLANTWLITIASMGLSAAILTFYYLYRYNFTR